MTSSRPWEACDTPAMPGRPSPRTLALLAALAALSGCAPTTLSPMGVRLAPVAPGKVTSRLGLRTGPKLSVPLSRPDEFRGDEAPFSFPQWAFAYDAELLVPLGEGPVLHLGAQGEVGCDNRNYSCPAPVPGYGLSMGLSHAVGTEDFSVAPALTLRGATDFGLATEGGPGSQVGAELAVTFALHAESTSVGLVPFCGVHRVIGLGGDTVAVYYGLVLAGHFAVGDGEFLELTGGLGRVRMQGGPEWSVPLFGVRGGP